MSPPWQQGQHIQNQATTSQQRTDSKIHYSSGILYSLILAPVFYTAGMEIVTLILANVEAVIPSLLTI
jgi:hypothetical protein